MEAGKVDEKAGESATVTLRRVALVIDDIGYDLNILKCLLAVDAPLSFAVLPYATHTVESVEAIRRTGRDLLLHLPMEPWNGRHGEEGMLLVSMTRAALRRQLQRDLDAVWPCVGVNNHMGSRFTEDGERLSWVFEILKERGVFFVDSRTTSRSEGRRAAEKTGLAYGVRSVFIDDYADRPEAIPEILKPMEDPLIMIGHPYGRTVDMLEKMVESLKKEGFVIVSISPLLKDGKTR